MTRQRHNHFADADGGSGLFEPDRIEFTLELSIGLWVMCKWRKCREFSSNFGKRRGHTCEGSVFASCAPTRPTSLRRGDPERKESRAADIQSRKHSQRCLFRNLQCDEHLSQRRNGDTLVKWHHLETETLQIWRQGQIHSEKLSHTSRASRTRARLGFQRSTAPSTASKTRVA